MTQALTSVRQFVFARSDGSFAGMASPTAVRDGLSAAFSRLADFYAQLRDGEGTRDVQREFDRTLDLWSRKVQPHEAEMKVGVRMPLLSEWLGERLITRCVRIDPEHGLTMTQVHQIVDSLLPAVPVERRRPEPRDAPSIDLMVVDETPSRWISHGSGSAPACLARQSCDSCAPGLSGVRGTGHDSECVPSTEHGHRPIGDCRIAI